MMAAPQAQGPSLLLSPASAPGNDHPLVAPALPHANHTNEVDPHPRPWWASPVGGPMGLCGGLMQGLIMQGPGPPGTLSAPAP